MHRYVRNPSLLGSIFLYHRIYIFTENSIQDEGNETPKEINRLAVREGREFRKIREEKLRRNPVVILTHHAWHTGARMEEIV